MSHQFKKIIPVDILNNWISHLRTKTVAVTVASDVLNACVIAVKDKNRPSPVIKIRIIHGCSVRYRYYFHPFMIWVNVSDQRTPFGIPTCKRKLSLQRAGSQVKNVSVGIIIMVTIVTQKLKISITVYIINRDSIVNRHDVMTHASDPLSFW